MLTKTSKFCGLEASFYFEHKNESDTVVDPNALKCLQAKIKNCTGFYAHLRPKVSGKCNNNGYYTRFILTVGKNPKNIKIGKSNISFITPEITEKRRRAKLRMSLSETKDQISNAIRLITDFFAKLDNPTSTYLEVFNPGYKTYPLSKHSSHEINPRMALPVFRTSSFLDFSKSIKP
ncbi:MAG: hypothetical protein VKJ06_08290 [Vampirovibrionales bacterium]|nr:hypothetical protein [Vampirovibrionales bacterium]